MIIQWYGSPVDQWLKGKECDPTFFNVCHLCWDGIISTDIDPYTTLIPRQRNEPQGTFLAVAEEQSDGKCEICRR